MTEDDAIAVLRRKVSNKQAAFARAHQIKPSLLAMVLRRERSLASKAILDAVGLERIEHPHLFRRKPKGEAK